MLCQTVCVSTSCFQASVVNNKTTFMRNRAVLFSAIIPAYFGLFLYFLYSNDNGNEYSTDVSCKVYDKSQAISADY